MTKGTYEQRTGQVGDVIMNMYNLTLVKDSIV